jgi:hypothetical protein
MTALQSEPQDGSYGKSVSGADSAAVRIAANFTAFEKLVTRAEHNYAKGNFDAAAIDAALAGHIATSTHCGIFGSPRLERMLVSMGRELNSKARVEPARKASTAIRTVLHVATEVHINGGLTRMISRWIAADRKRTNSLALTQHRGPIPQHLSDAVANSGGRIHHINHRIGGQFTWARELRTLAQDYDAVVLHIFCEDVIPLLAFAEPELSPPVLLLNHADHLFWLGSGISHAVLNLRDAARDLAEHRRGIEPKRNLLLPTIIDPTIRMRTRAEAKQAIGLDPNRTLLLSVARAAKYATMNGVTYADMHVPLLLRHPKAELLVVGAFEPEDWKPAIRATGGRIQPLPTKVDPRPYFEAGDIYVDSYPFVSSTSMMEAAGYGLPLVTLFTVPGEARIYGINHFGLVGTAHVAKSFQEYEGVLDRLITDEDFRAQEGARAQDAVTRVHAPPGWLSFLDDVYARAVALPPLDNTKLLASDETEQPFFGEPDRRHEDMFRSDYPMSEKLKSYMGMVNTRQHWVYWNELRRMGAFENWKEASRLMLPEWLRRVVKDRALAP